MTKPKILVTSAAGRTGAATVLQLLEKGFPMLNEPVLAHDSPEWRATAEEQELNLLPATAERHAHII